MEYFIVLIAIIFILIKNPKSIGWLFIYLISNPGGISEQYLSKSSLGGFSYVDIFFFLTFAVIILGRYNVKDFFNNKNAAGIFIILLIFSLYKVFVWGLIIPDPSIGDYFRYCIVRERDAIFGFLFIIPAYLFAMRDLKSLFRIMILIGIIIMSLSVISLISGSDIIQIRRIERYKGSDIMRYILQGYTFIILLIPVSIVVITGKLKVIYRKVVIFSGMLAVMLIIVSLTKGLYIIIIGSALAAVYITIKVLKQSVPAGIQRILLFASIAFIALLLSFPRYSDYASKSATDIFMLATQGVTTEGESTRFWQIPAFMHEIKGHPLFGTGWGYAQLSKEFDINQFDATDLPVLAHIMQYGIIGIGIYLLYYYRILHLILNSLKCLKTMDRATIIIKYKYELLFIIGISSYFIGYFLRIYQIFIELTKGTERIYLSIFTGILLACLQRLNKSEFVVSGKNNLIIPT